jgi:hypothetical protein
MKKLMLLLLITTLFNGCMLKRLFHGGHGGGHNSHMR